MGTKISALPKTTTLTTATCEFPVVEGGTTDRIDGDDLKEELAINDKAERWQVVETSKYTALPASTSTLTMSDSSDFTVGCPVKFSFDGTTYYSYVTAIGGGVITIAGATFNVGVGTGELDDLSFGLKSMLVQVDFFISGQYADGIGSLLADDMNTAFRWGLGDAYLVGFLVRHQTPDSTTEPKINVRVNTLDVGTEDGNAGPQLNGTNWVANSAIALDVDRYKIEWGESVEIYCSAAGGTGDAADLTISCHFVLE